MKSANSYDTDMQIKETLNKATEDITPSDTTLNNIKYNLSQKGDFTMKNRTFLSKKVVLVTAVLVASISTICIGAGSLFKSTISVSSRNDQITHYPTAAEISEHVDYMPKYPENLPGDFTFKSAQPRTETLMDENGNPSITRETIDFDYVKQSLTNNQYLSLSTGPATNEQLSSSDYTDTTDYNGITLNYSDDTYKFAPPDYELTQEDEENMAKGHYYVSYGTDKIEIRRMQSVSWTDNGISYILLASDLDLSHDNMYAMAQAVINE